MLARELGRIGWTLCAFLAVAAAAGVLADEPRLAAGAGGVTVAVALLSALAGRLSGSARPLQENEALCVVALGFGLVPLLVAVPLAAAGTPWIDALFEAVSGITTTGLSTVGSLAERGTGYLFLRAWSQWYGGLGIVVVALALIWRTGAGARQLARAALGDHQVADGERSFVRGALGAYVGLTVLGLVGIAFAGVDPARGALYVLSAVSTGGFAPDDASLAALGPGRARAWILALSVLGAVPFTTYLVVPRRGWTTLLRDPQVRALVVAGPVVALALWGAARAAGEVVGWERLADFAALSWSAQSTTGFTPIDVGALDDASKLALVVSMVVGGGSTSSAGGLKLLRVIVLARVGWTLLRRVSLPRRAVLEPRLAGRRIEEREVQTAALVLVGFLLVVLVGWSAFLLRGHPALDSLFEVVSATATVGLSTGLTGPGLSPDLKLVLCGAMLMGRLEFLAWLVLLFPRTWIGRRYAT